MARPVPPGTLLDGAQIEVSWAKPVNKNDNLRKSHHCQSILTINSNYTNHNNSSINYNNISLSEYTQKQALSLFTTSSSSLSLVGSSNTFIIPSTSSELYYSNALTNNIPLQQLHHSNLYPFTSIINQSIITSNSYHSYYTPNMFTQANLHKHQTQCNPLFHHTMNPNSLLSNYTISPSLPSSSSSSSSMMSIVNPMNTLSTMKHSHHDINNNNLINKSINNKSSLTLNQICLNELCHSITKLNIEKNKIKNDSILNTEYKQLKQDQLNQIILKKCNLFNVKKDISSFETSTSLQPSLISNQNNSNDCSFVLNNESVNRLNIDHSSIDDQQITNANKKPFDSMDKRKLWKRLPRYGVPGKIVNVLRKSYDNTAKSFMDDSRQKYPRWGLESDNSACYQSSSFFCWLTVL
ncbi:unnamed protein product [Schistosoma mattheei]|uniref:Uncharacterized protein n=1 Tax=Schistosoma mattheei TaxID=31246 RepID=A0A183NI28_9TREM|nr:unnamed protein product [Schistosoma mattheei]